MILKAGDPEAPFYRVIDVVTCGVLPLVAKADSVTSEAWVYIMGPDGRPLGDGKGHSLKEKHPNPIRLERIV